MTPDPMASTAERAVGLSPRALTAIVLACVAIVLVELAGFRTGAARVAAGVMLGWFAPGAALLLALGFRRLSGPLEVVLAVPLSLAVMGLVSVVVDRTGLGLAPGQLMLGTLAVTQPLLLIALVRPPAPRALSSAPWPGASGGDGAAPARRDLVAAPAPRDLVASLASHVREPLFRNAYALALSGVLTSGLGVVYWAVAARLYPPEAVGVNAALLSLVTLLGNISQLNLRSGFSRFVPVAGRRVGRFLASGYLAAFVVAVLLSVATVVLLRAFPGLAPDIPMTPLVLVLFPLTTIAWTMFGLQDHALTALRRTVLVPIENAVFAALKLLLLVAFAGLFGAFGILASWTVPMLLLFAVVSAWIFARAVPAYASPAGRAPSPTPGTAEMGRTSDGPGPFSLRSILSYVGLDYLASLFSISATAILPVIVLSILGAVSAAHFYVVFLIASSAELLPSVLSTSLLVETSAAEARFERDGRRVLRLTAIVLVPLVTALVIGAPWILGVFGASYAAEGTNALRLFAVSAIPYTLIQLTYSRLRHERRLRLVLVSQAVLAIVTVTGSLLLLPTLGLVAPAIVSLAIESLVAVVLVRTQLWDVVWGDRPRSSARSDDASDDASDG